MGELTKNIFDIKRTKSYCAYNKFHVGNILGITKVSRWELMHSNFIAWILNPSGSHMLHNYPLQQFIMSLEFIKSKSDNNLARLSKDIIREFYDDSYIITADVRREFEHIDIHILVKTKDKILPVLIENKVESGENGKNKDQTNEYFKWGESTYSDKTEYYDPIYIFLLPEYKKSTPQKNANYIRMTYQELVDYVIEPAYYRCGDDESRNNIKLYLQCLSYQDDNEKGDRSMAISSEEKKILDDFIKENKNLLCAVINELGDEIDQTARNTIVNGLRDYTTYMFEDKTYVKNRLVLAVVKKYVEDKQPSYEELKLAFPDKLQGSYGVFKKESEINDKDKGLGTKGRKRYFTNQNEIIKLPSGENIMVSTQWIKDTTENFIENAKSLGYAISNA